MREPQRHRQLARPLAGKIDGAIEGEARRLDPLADGVRSEAKTTMGMALAQEFERMGGEVNDEQPAARAEYPRCLAKRALGIVEKVQDLVHGDQVEGVAREGQMVDVAEAHLGMTDASPVEIGARHCQ